VTAGTRARIAWALFDWANSPFTTLVVAFLFASYFTTTVVGDPVRGQVLWGYALGAGGALGAIAAPFLGALADAGGPRKPWILWSTVLCCGACLALGAVGAGDIALAMVVVALASLGFEAGTVFYNAMLPDICPADRLGRWSGWAWALGYGGGLAALAVGIALADACWSGPLCASWFAVFAVPLFRWTPDRPGTRGTLRQGLARLWQTARAVRGQRDLLRFLIGRMLYNDALVTVFVLGGVYVAGKFSMTLTQVGLFGILLNLTAGLGAWGFAWADDRLGSKPTILLSLGGLMVTGAGALLSEDLSRLWWWGGALGLFVGPAQAASRTMMARLAPRDRLAEYFGLYALSGRATSFMGPVLVGLATQASGDQRFGLAVVVAPLMLVGALLLVPISAGSGASR